MANPRWIQPRRDKLTSGARTAVVWRAPSPGRAPRSLEAPEGPHTPDRGRPSDGGRDVAGQDTPSKLPADFAKATAVVVQNRVALALVVLVAMMAAFAYALIQSASYEVGAQLIVKVGTEVVAPPSVKLRNAQTMPVAIGIENVNNEVQIMRDPAIVVDTVNALGEDFFFSEAEPVTLLQRAKRLAKDAAEAVRGTIEDIQVSLGLRARLTPLQKVIVALQGTIEINAVPQSFIIELGLRIGDRDGGVAILQMFIDTYLARRREIYESGEIASFFEDQLAPLVERLERSEAEYADAKRRLGAFSVAEQRTLLLEQDAKVKESLDAARVRSQRFARELAEIDDRLAALPETVILSEVEGRSPIADDARQRLLGLEVELAEVTRRTGQEGEEARTLREQIHLLNDRAGSQDAFRIEQRTTGINAVREDLERERETVTRSAAGVEAEVAALKEQADDIAGRLAAVEEARLELLRKEREIDQFATQRARLVQAVSESRVSQELSSARISNVVVAAAPQASLTPAGPKLALLLGVAAVVSLGAAGLLLVLREMMWPRVRSEADLVAALGASVPIAGLTSVRGLPA